MDRQLIQRFIDKAKQYCELWANSKDPDPRRVSMDLFNLAWRFEHYPEITDTDVLTWLPKLMRTLDNPDVFTAAQNGEVPFTVPKNPPGMDITVIAQRTGDLSFPME